MSRLGLPTPSALTDAFKAQLNWQPFFNIKTEYLSNAPYVSQLALDQSPRVAAATALQLQRPPSPPPPPLIHPYPNPIPLPFEARDSEPLLYAHPHRAAVPSAGHLQPDPRISVGNLQRGSEAGRRSERSTAPPTPQCRSRCLRPPALPPPRSSPSTLPRHQRNA